MVIYIKGGLYMWTRESIKTYAKDFLRKHYWKAFIVCLIFTIITGSHISGNVERRYEFNNSTSIVERIVDGSVVSVETGYDGLNFFLEKIGLLPIALIGLGIFMTIIVIWIVILLFINPILSVEKNRFFLNGFEECVDIKYLFSTFNKSEFWGIFKCMFITGLYNFLWYFLLIIPGIVKSYEYRFVPYILTKEPNLSTKEAIQRSREMTEDHKLNMFVLDLSFLGWYLLGLLFFGIGGIFVKPYQEASFAKLYNVLSGNDDIDDLPIAGDSPL